MVVRVVDYRRPRQKKTSSCSTACCIGSLSTTLIIDSAAPTFIEQVSLSCIIETTGISSDIMLASSSIMQRAIVSTYSKTLLPRRSFSLVTIGRRSLSSSNHNDTTTDKKKTIRKDPFARRPNQKCDPYGQGGKPLSSADAERLLLTVDPKWQLEYTTTEATTLVRHFAHDTFLDAAALVHHVAAVAEGQQHYPLRVQIERLLDSRAKVWTPTTTVRCHTTVLQGLSHHDFFLASVRI